MYREWKEIEFPKDNHIRIWKQDQEAYQERDEYVKGGRME
jgi:hypothetical protein